MLSAMVISIGGLQSVSEPLTSHGERSAGCTRRSWHSQERHNHLHFLPARLTAQPQESSLSFGAETVGLAQTALSTLLRELKTESHLR